MAFKLHHKSVAYATTTFGAHMMNAVFGYYYVKIFMNYYHVSQGWFQASQIVYMLWNAVNDPLFGYMQDNFSHTCLKSRRHSIMYGAPLYGIAFIVPWFPWSRSGGILTGLHLMFSLCLFDTLLTFVLLAQCALFTELSAKQEDRLKLVKYSQYASLLGSTSVFFCDYFSSGLDDFFAFQVICVGIAIVGFLCIRYTGHHAVTEYEELNVVKATSAVEEGEQESWGASLRHILKQTWEIVRCRDFLSFVFMNFCQVYHSAFLSGFAIIFCDQLVPKELIPPTVRSFFYGSLPFVSQIVVIIFIPIVGRFGYYKVVKASFILKFLLGITLFLLGPSPWFIMLFLLIDSAGCNGAFSLFNLSLSDVIDQDKERYGRKHPLSSMVFGTNALITKPAQSFAPMITAGILNYYGYSELKSSGDMKASSHPDLHSAMFDLMCVTSAVLGIIQLVIWTRYQLRSSHEVVGKYTEADD